MEAGGLWRVQRPPRACPRRAAAPGWARASPLLIPPRPPTPRRQLKVQAEYVRRRESGVIADSTGAVLADDYRNTSSGWYLQSVYQFAPRWRVGARYDSLDSGTPGYFLAPPDLMIRSWN